MQFVDLFVTVTHKLQARTLNKRQLRKPRSDVEYSWRHCKGELGGDKEGVAAGEARAVSQLAVQVP